MELIQTICAVLALGLSSYATYQVVNIKNNFKYTDKSNRSVNQKIKGDNNTQSNNDK